MRRTKAIDRIAEAGAANVVAFATRMMVGTSANRKSTNPHSVVGEDHDRTNFDVIGDIVEVGNQSIGLMSGTAVALTKQNQARQARVRPSK